MIRLPVRQRVAFKIAGLMHQSLAGAAPAYLADDCHLLSDAGRHTLRSHSNDIRKLLVPRTHNKLGDRSFSAAGPRLWNDLPPGLRQPGLSFDSYRRSLKTSLWRLKRLVTFSTYRRYINKCIYLNVSVTSAKKVMLYPAFFCLSV